MCDNDCWIYVDAACESEKLNKVWSLPSEAGIIRLKENFHKALMKITLRMEIVTTMTMVIMIMLIILLVTYPPINCPLCKTTVISCIFSIVLFSFVFYIVWVRCLVWVFLCFGWAVPLTHSHTMCHIVPASRISGGFGSFRVNLRLVWPLLSKLKKSVSVWDVMYGETRSSPIWPYTPLICLI